MVTRQAEAGTDFPKAACVCLRVGDATSTRLKLSLCREVLWTLVSCKFEVLQLFLSLTPSNTTDKLSLSCAHVGITHIVGCSSSCQSSARCVVFTDRKS